VLARSACACAMRASALDDEVRFDAMEFQPVVKIALGEFDEVRGRNRGEVFVKDEFDRAFICLYYCSAIVVLWHYFLSEKVGRSLVFPWAGRAKVRHTPSLFTGVAHCDMNDSIWN
jgi:hypothetical protein